MAGEAQLILRKTSDALLGWTLTVQADAAGDCDEILVEYRNRYPGLGLGNNKHWLRPFWTSRDAPPCELCVNAVAAITIPEVQAIALFDNYFGVWSNYTSNATFRLRFSGGDWSSVQTISFANEADVLDGFNAALAEIGGGAAKLIARTFSAGGGVGFNTCVAVVVCDQFASTPILEIDYQSGAAFAEQDVSVTRLQTGGGTIKNDIQILGVEFSAIVDEGDFAWDSNSTTASASADAAATQTAMEALFGAGNVSVPVKTFGIWPIVVQGTYQNTNVVTVSAVTDAVVKSVVNGGPVS